MQQKKYLLHLNFCALYCIMLFKSSKCMNGFHFIDIMNACANKERALTRVYCVSARSFAGIQKAKTFALFLS